MNYNDVLKELNALADSKYKDFNSRIIRTSYHTIGVRTPDIVRLGKKVAKQFPAYLDEFLMLESFSYEELFIASLFISSYDYESGKAALLKLLPRFENWSIVDQGIGRFTWMKKNLDRTLADFAFLKDDDTILGGEFYRRTYVIILLTYCVTETHIDFVLSELATIRNGEYYVDMAIAWLLSVCFIKFYDKTMHFLKTTPLTPSILTKTIGKCRDSFRLTPAQKAEVKQLAQ